MLASESLGWVICNMVLVAVAVEMYVAQMFKLLSSQKVSVAVVAGADGSFPLTCSGCYLEVLQPGF